MLKLTTDVTFLLNLILILLLIWTLATQAMPISNDAYANSDFSLDETKLADFSVQSQADIQNNDAKAGFKISLLPEPEKTAESVNLEHEAIPSKILSFYDNSQKKVGDFTHPQPILDTISEHEKYGNNGDMFDGVSRSLVNGYEAFSNILNKFIQAPKELMRSISKSITGQLDIIGGKLVGL